MKYFPGQPSCPCSQTAIGPVALRMQIALHLPMKKCNNDSSVEDLDLLRHLQFVPARLAGYKPCRSGSQWRLRIAAFVECPRRLHATCTCLFQHRVGHRFTSRNRAHAIDQQHRLHQAFARQVLHHVLHGRSHTVARRLTCHQQRATTVRQPLKQSLIEHCACIVRARHLGRLVRLRPGSV